MANDLYIPPEAQTLLNHWCGDGLIRDWPSESLDTLWYGFQPEQDEDLRRRYGALVDQALAGGLGEWAATPLGRLALVLLLDQLTRNLFRRQARAFAGDARAQALTREAIAMGEDEGLPVVARVFLYMPLMHAESLALQDEGVRRFERLREQAPAFCHATLDEDLRYARQHRDIVARFGRFPHRNEALGRTSTAEELAFLHDGPRFGQ